MKTQPSSQSGFTLVELMIAITLGSILTSAVLASYIATSRSLAEDERYALMQENGRYALKVLSNDLAMADFWGQMVNTTVITSAVALAAANCGAEADVLDPVSAVMFNNYHDNAIGAAPPDVHFTPCAEVANDIEDGTDLLVVKRVEGSPSVRTFVDINDTNGNGNTTEVLTEGSAVADAVYLRTNGTVGTFIDNAPATAPATGEADWRYVPRLYYVRDHFLTAGDGIPTLCRMDLVVSGGTPGLGELTNPATFNGNLDQPSCLAEGVEDLHLQFGVDTDADGFANTYSSAPTLAEMETVVTVRVYLLMRSSTPVPHYTNTKSYRLGDVVVGAANDGFLRRVYSTTVSLRNPTNLSLLNG